MPGTHRMSDCCLLHFKNISEEFVYVAEAVILHILSEIPYMLGFSDVKHIHKLLQVSRENIAEKISRSVFRHTYEQ